MRRLINLKAWPTTRQRYGGQQHDPKNDADRVVTTRRIGRYLGSVGSADGMGWVARFNFHALAVDGSGNVCGGHGQPHDRKVTPQGVTTLAGVPGSPRLFNEPLGGVDGAGNILGDTATMR
jgi:hypothetical protein